MSKFFPNMYLKIIKKTSRSFQQDRVLLSPRKFYSKFHEVTKPNEKSTGQISMLGVLIKQLKLHCTQMMEKAQPKILNLKMYE